MPKVAAQWDLHLRTEFGSQNADMYVDKWILTLKGLEFGCGIKK